MSDNLNIPPHIIQDIYRDLNKPRKRKQPSQKRKQPPPSPDKDNEDEDSNSRGVEIIQM